MYPIIGLWALLIDEISIYEKVQLAKANHLAHCNFQLWYPDEISEEHFYLNNELHGVVLSSVCIDQTGKEFLAQICEECEKSNCFENLSAIQQNIWPLILVACRHYRIPIPLQMISQCQASYE